MPDILHRMLKMEKSLTFPGEFTRKTFVLQISVWDSLTWWWRSEEVGVIRKRKKPMTNRAMLKPKPKE